MAPPVVGIGITTYKDIWTADFGSAFYELLASQPVSLAPTKARAWLWGTAQPIGGSADFASVWRSETAFERLEGRSKSNPVLERGNYREPVAWSRNRTLEHFATIPGRPDCDRKPAGFVAALGRGAERLKLREQFADKVRSLTGMSCIVELVPPRTLLRTSSGKLSRAKPKKLYLAGEIAPIQPAA